MLEAHNATQSLEINMEENELAGEPEELEAVGEEEIPKSLVGQTVVVYWMDKEREKELIQNCGKILRIGGFLTLEILDKDGALDRTMHINLVLIRRYVHR